VTCLAVAQLTQALGRANFRFISIMKLYLAGKIDKHDWRHNIVPDLRNWDYYLLTSGYSLDRLQEWPVWHGVILGNHDYTGPYFIGCDHGCYHGSNEHGYGINSNGCGSSGTFAHTQVFTMCHAAIQKCDVFFAWIDTTDCYGTIAEIGLAYGLRRKILVAGPKMFDDMWFVYQMASRKQFGIRDPVKSLEKLLNTRVDYYEYIRSDEWRAKANAAKERVGYRCQVCNQHRSETILDAHHRTYERLGNEHPDDITVLCRDCHKLYERNKRLKQS
jgi:hypothetical protein